MPERRILCWTFVRSSTVIVSPSKDAHHAALDGTRMPGSQTTQGRTGARSSAPIHVAFRVTYGVGTLETITFAAQWLACPRPCQRFALCLAAPHA